MKKIISVMLAVLLLAAFCASAGAEAYKFSNGVQFGMSVEDVRAVLAGEDADAADFGHLTQQTEHVSKLDVEELTCSEQ